MKELCDHKKTQFKNILSVVNGDLIDFVFLIVSFGLIVSSLYAIFMFCASLQDHVYFFIKVSRARRSCAHRLRNIVFQHCFLISYTVVVK